MISKFEDVTIAFNASNAIVLDVSSFDYIVVQFVAPTGTINVQSTNDGGAVLGITSGSAALAINFTAVQATKLADGTSVTAVVAAGLYKLSVTGKYVSFGGTAAAASKVIVQFFMIA